MPFTHSITTRVEARRHLQALGVMTICGGILIAPLAGCSDDSEPSDPLPPLSIVVSATPESVPAGGTTTLSWTAMNADSVSISKEPDGPLVIRGPIEGSWESPPLDARTVFVVSAERNQEVVTASVAVEVGLRDPSIGAFAVVPQTVAFGEEVTLAWATQDAERVEIYEDGRPLTVAFDRAASGSFSYVADRPQLRFGLRAINANAVATATVVVDVDLPETSTVARRGDEARRTFQGRIAPRTTQVIEVEVSEPGVLVAEVGSPRLQQCDATLKLMIVDPQGTVMGVSGTIITPLDEPYDCGRLDPNYTPEAAALSVPGTYLLLVVSEAEAEVPFEVSARQYGVGCGNGFVEPGEFCDDGNLVDDDRCSSECVPNPIDATTASFDVEIGTLLDPFRRFRFEVDEVGRSLTASVAAPDGSNCGTNTLGGIVRPGANFPIGNGAFVTGCGGIVQPRDAYAADLPPGTFDVILLNPGVDPGPGKTVRVQFGLATPECGNGITEVNAGEDCDDRNDQSGDGCTSACSFESDIQVEVEPNNLSADATLISLQAPGEWTTVAAGINPADDNDRFAFEVPDGFGLEIRTYDLLADPSVCNAPDTLMQLVRPDGQAYTNDDRPTPNFSRCSYLNLPSPQPAGRYELQVVEFDPTVIRNRYFVDIRLTTQ